MSLFKRGKIWYYKFKFGGVLIKESTGLTNEIKAGEAEDKRKVDLREGRAGIARRKGPVIFSAAAEAWFKAKRVSGNWKSSKTEVNEKLNLEHLKSYFGHQLLTDINHEAVISYWENRRRVKAADKTVSNELGSLRGILLYHDLDSQWASIRKKVKLKEAEDVARPISIEEETCLLNECQQSRSRSLPVIVTLAIQTGMRRNELRLLQWQQVDFARKVVRVGKSKTPAGTGREIPMTIPAFQTLSFWAGNFPKRKPVHYVFPAEKYGAAGDDFKPKTYDTDPSKPIATFKEAWEAAKERAGVECRFHDLRATALQRLRDAGTPFPIIAAIMGWSPATTVRMTKRYGGDVTLDAKRTAIAQMENFSQKLLEGAQKGAQSQTEENAPIQ